MKKNLQLFIHFTVVLISLHTFAQTEAKPWQVEIGFNAIDVFPTGQSPYGQLFEDFFNVQEHWNISPFLSYIGVSNYVGRGFSLGFRFGFNTLTQYGPFPVNTGYFNADALIKYNLNTLIKWRRLEPYLEFGGGYSVFGEKGDGSFNMGAGLTYLLGEKRRVGLTMGTLYKATGLSYGKKHFQHLLGLQFRFGRVDTDGDGIVDEEDQCPEIPGLAAFAGCPDTDGDGLPDPEDQCPDLAGQIALGGCPDRDGDGVIDNLDQCPDTPGLAALNGCPDQDGDGVTDAEDACPETPGEPALQGCPDQDGDGISDAEDECPDVPGTQIHNGCPEMDQQTQQTLNDLGEVIFFAYNSYSVIPASIDVLERIYEILRHHPDAQVKVTGHTDAKGSESFNLALSEMRAQTVVNYLVKRGLNAEQFEVIGKGETEPVATNATPEGRAANRRVVFSVQY